MEQNKNYELALPNQDAGSIDKMVEEGTGGYLQRLSLMCGVSDAVIEGRARVGEFWLGKKNLGNPVKAVFGVYRAHATKFENKQLTAESFDANSEVFQGLQKEAARWKKGVKAGPEFLVYFPEIDAYGTLQFARSTLEASPEFAKARGKLIEMGTVIKGKKNKYHVPVVNKVLSEAAPVGSEEDLAEAMEQFMEPLLEAKSEAAGSRPR